MSPAGISLFYASSDATTAVAEIAGHGVEPFAVIGRFVNRRVLRVLDFTRTPAPISPFDLARREEARLARFLNSFVGHVTAPVIPDGRQHVEYAPTQVMTEFFRWVPEPRLDGVVLPSAQNTQPTYVLFFGSTDFSTKGDAAPERMGFLRLGDESDQDKEQPCFELDPDGVKVHRVERKYAALPTGGWSRAAPPRLRGSRGDAVREFRDATA